MHLHGSIRIMTDVTWWGVQSSTAAAVHANCSNWIIGHHLLSLLHSATTDQDAYYRKELAVDKLTSFNLLIIFSSWNVLLKGIDFVGVPISLRRAIAWARLWNTRRQCLFLKPTLIFLARFLSL